MTRAISSRIVLLAIATLAVFCWSPCLAQLKKKEGIAWHPKLKEIDELLQKMDNRISAEMLNVTRRYDSLVEQATAKVLVHRRELQSRVALTNDTRNQAQRDANEVLLALQQSNARQQALDTRAAALDGALEAARQDLREEIASRERDLNEGRIASEATMQSGKNMLKDELSNVASIRELLGQLHLTRKPETYKAVSLVNREGGSTGKGTEGFGGAYDPSTGQFVFPKYAKKSPLQCNVYDSSGVLVGNRTLGSDTLGGMVMQLWYDEDGKYYVANYDAGVVKKVKDKDVLWSFELPGDASAAAGVAVDQSSVYTMSTESSTVAILDRATGKQTSSVVLKGGAFLKGKPTKECGPTNGALVVAAGSLFYGCSKAHLIYKYDLKSGAVDSSKPPIRTKTKIDLCAFDGQFACIGDKSATLHCYKLLDVNVYDSADHSNTGVRSLGGR